ncbi:hypothetical protein [Paenibacillus assamensis]|uniref:hypothetical protein n=1 Tax=Paenibacillus assamensis TaxID=311244 RepID=UPI00041FA8D0|nr:hypothetical protein [Paenibacillus assamensis]
MSRILIRKLIIQGLMYRRTIEFNEGLTIISGEKTSGKSLVLSLIDYCFGKSGKIDLSVQKELASHCDEVFLEMKINDEVITLRRPIKENQTKISIYFCAFEELDTYTPRVFGIKEAMKFLMRKLNINEYKLIKNKKHSNEKEIESISFRDIFRYVYIHQHELGTNNFLQNIDAFKRYKNPHAFKLMFNLVEADKNELSDSLVRTENEIEETKKDISGLVSYLKDKDAEDRIGLQAKSDKFIESIDEQKKIKTAIISNSKSNSNNENEMYIKLKKDLELITNEIYDYQSKKKQIQLSINSKKLLLEEYNIEQAEVDATLEVNYKLVISEQQIECPLCNSNVVNTTSEVEGESKNSEKMLRNVKKEITNKIVLVTNLMKHEMKNIEEMDIHIKRLTKKQNLFNEAIVEFTKETDVPFLSQIDSINVMINRLIKDHEMIKEGLRIHHKIDEKKNHIIGLEATALRYKNELNDLQVNEEYKEEVFSFLDKEYKKIMYRLKYNTDGATYIDVESHIPYFEGASVYVHESGGLLECMQLSYLGAILISKVENYALGHPGFLLLDSISKYFGTLKKNDQEEEKLDVEKTVTQEEVKSILDEKSKINDPEVYQELYEILIELSDNHQIILVENTPPEKVDKYTKYTFLSGKHGLVDLSQNELTDMN